ncbi:hypothetical protein [Aliikangiella coralliicola]|uniref:DUF2345 domain-containing protein n=1 Tax=Aliikangiella coralliicola TaxID=2592383 RepID=A0A545UGB3_9GAMM|nr:hypothetical protein [Aliikangiella coralliicola]TQV88497.1 hypothetical protein FLL46_08205 [Aliikangiella coralliicola]
MTTLLCRIELNKQEGVLITVDNEADSIVHTIVLNDKSITTTSKGSSQTSTMIQTPDSISLSCKDFKLEADNISCHANQKTSHTSGGDFAISSDANFDASAVNDASLGANNVNVSGTTLIKAEGGMIKLQ